MQGIVVYHYKKQKKNLIFSHDFFQFDQGELNHFLRADNGQLESDFWPVCGERKGSLIFLLLVHQTFSKKDPSWPISI